MQVFPAEALLRLNRSCVLFLPPATFDSQVAASSRRLLLDFHCRFEATNIVGLVALIIRPMTSAQTVRFFFRTLSTSFSKRARTHSSSPPLVCASASRILRASGTPLQSVSSFAALRFS